MTNVYSFMIFGIIILQLPFSVVRWCQIQFLESVENARNVVSGLLLASP